MLTDLEITRRQYLQAATAGSLAAGLNFPQTSRASEVTLGFGKARRCLFIYLFGAAPQHETFDPKPQAPVEIQGELKAIPTSLAGVQFCEGLPRVAQVADRLTIIRSMSHIYPLHGAAYAMTGLPVYTTDIEAKPRDPSLWPYLGSVADYFWTQANGGRKTNLLQHVGLPWIFNAQAEDLGHLAGPYGAFLGQTYDPLWARFTGVGLKVAPKCRHEQPKEYTDPYAACSKDGRFVIDGAGALSEGVTADRLSQRRDLLDRFDAQRQALDQAEATRQYSGRRQQALELLTSPQLREALDIGRENDTLREAYGYTLFGQSCLAARRLLESGSRFVTLFWDAYGTYFSGGWDTHQNHYPRLKQYLLPGFDAGFSTLINDLEQRGLLEDTLVVCTTEHGRTPQIDSKPVGAARHHWSKAYSTVLAGGGVHRGAVVGRTDAQGGDVAECPVSPKDILATSLHLLGIDAHAVVHDRQNRPYPAAGDGQVRPELLA